MTQQQRKAANSPRDQHSHWADEFVRLSGGRTVWDGMLLLNFRRLIFQTACAVESSSHATAGSTEAWELKLMGNLVET